MVDFASPKRFLSITAAWAPQESVEAAIEVVNRRLNLHLAKTAGGLDLTQLYEVEPPPGGIHSFKIALWTPESAPLLCVYVTNLSDGWSSMSHLVSREAMCFQIQIKSTRDAVEFPQHMFETWRDGKPARLVMVMRDDDGWKFFEKGDLEEFEDASNYSRRSKRDRLGREDVSLYLQRLGVSVHDPRFWQAGNSAVLYTQTNLKRQP